MATADEKPKEQEKPRGLECPRCGCRHFEVDRTQAADASIKRKRFCRHCGTVVWTKETIWAVPPQK